MEVQLLKVIDNLFKKYIEKFDFETIIEEKKKGLNTYGTVLIKKINKLEIDIKETNLKMEKIYMDRLDDVISVVTYKKMLEKLEVKKQELINEKQELQKSYDDYWKNNYVDKFFNSSKIIEEYLKVRKSEKRDFLVKIIDRIEIHQDKTVDVYFKLKPLGITA